MGLKGDVFNLKSLSQNLRALPVSMANDIAARSAPALTEETREAFSTGRNVYGDPRPAGAGGRSLTLVRTGATRSALAFVRAGRIVRAALPIDYMRFLIGKFGILPNGNAALPVSYTERIGRAVREYKAPL